MRILLVEDDQVLGVTLQASLCERGYIVDWLTDGEVAKAALAHESFDLLLLDLGLPKILGLDLLKQIRDQGNTIPVIIVTARDTLADKIACLDGGADDFLSKPFELDELCARINVCCRRAAGRAIPMLRVGHITLCPASRKAWWHGKPVKLLRREFALLEALMANQGSVISRDILIQKMYGWGKNVDSNTLEVYIHNLRNKLKTGCIVTVRGIGYVMEEAEDDADPLKGA